MSEKVVVIGGGIAGMEASAHLSEIGYEVTLLEKTDKLGGHLLKWDRLFPTNRKGGEVLQFLKDGIQDKVEVITNVQIIGIDKLNNEYRVKLHDGKVLEANAILLSTGYDLFDAHRKEEYGYGIYDNVITSAELEELFLNKKEIRTKKGKVPARIGLVHCVGSRDEKVGNIYCSKVCCVTAVKQAIELKQKLPKAEIFCFYMDMRMFGMHFEELYKEAQEKYGINFVRGRLSEASENIDGQLVLKVEDTLVGRPLKMTADLLVLLVGIVASKGTKEIGEMLGIDFNENGFAKVMDEHTMTNSSKFKGIFLAGSCTAPRTITNTITDARAAAAQISSYLKGYSIASRK